MQKCRALLKRDFSVGSGQMSTSSNRWCEELGPSGWPWWAGSRVGGQHQAVGVCFLCVRRMWWTSRELSVVAKTREVKPRQVCLLRRCFLALWDVVSLPPRRWVDATRKVLVFATVRPSVKFNYYFYYQIIHQLYFDFNIFISKNNRFIILSCMNIIYVN